MPRYIDTRGHTKIAIGICGRCKQKFPYDELMPDPNYPAVYVCKDDLDELDPYRLPARGTEDISLEHPRPDAALTDFQPTPLFGSQQIGSITALGPAHAWQPNTFYAQGNTVTSADIDDQNINLPISWFVCTRAGTSGATPPTWPEQTGVIVADHGTLLWLALGERRDSFIPQ